MLRMIGGVVVASLAVGSLAGCGKPASAAPMVVMRDAPQKTLAARTARVSVNVYSLSSHAPASNVLANGVEDFTATKGDLTFDSSTIGAPAGTGKIEELFFGTTIYLKMPGLEQRTGGKPYARLDLEKIDASKGIDLAALDSRKNDPTDVLSSLSGVSDDVRAVGHDTVRGAGTTHYHATADLAKAAAASPNAASSIDALQRMLGTTTYPVDVWIDKSGRVRRFQYVLDLGKAAAASGQQSSTSTPITGQMTSVIEIYDYGVAVNVTEPPPDQAADLTAAATAGPSHP